MVRGALRAGRARPARGVAVLLPVLAVSACTAPTVSGTDPGPRSAATAPVAGPVAPSGSSAPGADIPPALLDQARAEGPVRVVVTLVLPGQRSGPGASPADPEQQRAAISSVQRSLADELAPFGVRILTRHELLPVMTLVADEAALLHLAGSPLVVSVDADAPESPG